MPEKMSFHRLTVRELRVATENSDTLTDGLCRMLRVAPDCVRAVTVQRRSVDARRAAPLFVFTVTVEVFLSRRRLTTLLRRPNITRTAAPARPVQVRPLRMQRPPVVVGTGPAGLFAAMTLVRRGAVPIVFERGPRIPQRARLVELLWETGTFDPEANVLFGEGGAGTFSDGKLTFRGRSPLKQTVMQTFRACGAPEAISSQSRPHLGTDLIRRIIPAMVDDLQRRGVKFHFSTAVSDIVLEHGRVAGVVAGGIRHDTDMLFLATGHSARDMYRVLQRRGITLQRKGFAAGLRIEHPRAHIDAVRLGRKRTDAGIGAAEYHLTFQDPITGRGVYTFCMCPGGQVIGCASTHEELCVNGMSDSTRNGPFSNAAVVVTVREEDFPGTCPLAGLRFQEELERKTYQCGGGGYVAPVQRARAFVAHGKGTPVVPRCTYRPAARGADLHGLLPQWIADPLQRGLVHFDCMLPGFVDEGVLVGCETRTSAPVRILRDRQTCQAPGAAGLIPIGEGAGYAGGIVSSAVDGIAAALCVDAP